MISREPIIRVGLLEHAATVKGKFEGEYEVDGSLILDGNFDVRNDHGMVVLSDAAGNPRARGPEIRCRAAAGSRCQIQDMMIGQKFHWERKEDQVFGGDILFRVQADDTLMIINEIPLEEYSASVISSEMSASAPSELLQAHAVISRSWLVAMIEKGREKTRTTAQYVIQKEGEIIRWYGREDHIQYDVCADDHCQRYHGLSRIKSDSVNEAIKNTRGTFLVYDGEICDARYSKACGGRTENYESAWEDTPIPYLKSVDDSLRDHSPLTREHESIEWILGTPEAYCNTNDKSILRQILPSFDQETKDFFRWQISYEREQLDTLLKENSEIDFGTLLDIIPLMRGPSARIVRLEIIGSKRSVIVGKELEIRRWFSKTHLKSSAFVIAMERNDKGIPEKFTFRGAGWGHGVGLCQIGAAVMATQGRTADEILHHYYQGSEIKKLY